MKFYVVRLLSTEMNLDQNKMYTIQELAEESSWSEKAIRGMFRHHPLTQKKPGPTRQRVHTRIPGNVALQVFQDLQKEPVLQKPAKKKPRRVEYLYPDKHKKAVARALALTTAVATRAA